MDIIFSYGFSFEAKQDEGTGPSASTNQLLSFLEQAQGATLTNARSFTLNTPVAVGSSSQLSYDLRTVGINYVRSIMVKSDLKINCTLDTNTFKGTFIFVDLGEPTSVTALANPYTLVLGNPNSTVAQVRLALIGY